MKDSVDLYKAAQNILNASAHKERANRKYLSDDYNYYINKSLNKYVIECVLPLFDIKDIKVTLEFNYRCTKQDYISIKACNSKYNSDDFNEKYIIESDMDIDFITSIYKDGILYVQIPRKEYKQI
jgi:HSP20 family molecular chaperone IbpA